MQTETIHALHQHLHTYIATQKHGHKQLDIRLELTKYWTNDKQKAAYPPTHKIRIYKKTTNQTIIYIHKEIFILIDQTHYQEEQDIREYQQIEWEDPQLIEKLEQAINNWLKI